MTVEPILEEVLNPSLLRLPILSPNMLEFALALLCWGQLGREGVKWCRTRQNFISQCYLVVSEINDQSAKVHSPDNLSVKYIQVHIKSKPPSLPEMGRNYILTQQEEKKKGSQKVNKNTSKLILSFSHWMFIHTCTSATASQPPAAVLDARTGSTFIQQPGFFLLHHCQGLAQEHGTSGIHGPS